MQLCADAIIVCLPDSFYMPHFERKATVGMPSQRQTELLPVFQGAAFGPHATRVMVEAYERTCQSLNDVSQPKIVKEIIARRIVGAAKSGERDPEQLYRLALKELGFNQYSTETG